jgi:hypothetical protein
MTVRLLVTLCALAGAVPALAQDAGRVVSTQGVVSVQRASGAIGTISKDSPIRNGDTIQTQARSTVRLRMTDGSEMLVRPESTLRVENYAFVQARPQEDSLVLQLLRGGMRTVTGLIGKRKPDSFRLGTTIATIGVRGTDFVARVCEGDCKRETGGAPVRSAAPAQGIIGRVFSLTGTLTATSPARPAQRLGRGDAFLVGDVLETGPKSVAVLAFQDGSRIVLESATRFAADQYRYQPTKAEENVAAFRLLKGALRALTGVIGQRNPDRFTLQTTVATIGVRGTGFDASCTGPCAEEQPGAPAAAPADGRGSGLLVYVWKGRVPVKNKRGLLELLEGWAGEVSGPDAAPQRLDPVPDFFLRNPTPRPDQLDIDTQQLFGAQNPDFSEPGIYVYVRDGIVTMKGAKETFSLTRGEVGYFDTTGQKFERLGLVPTFLERDSFTGSIGGSRFACIVN